MSTTSPIVEYSPIVETSIDLDMTPGAVMPVVNASQTDDLRLLTIYLYANGTQYYLYHPSFSHEELSMVLNGKKPDGNIFSYTCEFAYDSNKAWAYFNKQMTAVAGEVLCELVVYATNTEEESAEPRQVGSANFVLQVEESPTGGPDSESTLQSLDQIRHELGIAVIDSRQSASKAAESASKAAESASKAAESEKNATESASKATESEKNAAHSASQATETAHKALFSAGQAAESEKNAALSASQAAESEKTVALSASQAAESEKNAALSASQAAKSEQTATLSASQAVQAAQKAIFSAGQATESEKNAALSASQATDAKDAALAAEAAAKNWAVGPSGTGSGTDTNNSKYYSDQASAKYDAFVEATTPIIYKGTWDINDTLDSKTHTFAEIYAMRDNLTKNSFHLYANGPGDEEITCDYAHITQSMITLQFLYGFNVGATKKLYRIIIQHASDDTVTVNRELLVTYSGLQNGIAEGDGIDITNGVISVKLNADSGLDFDSDKGLQAAVKDVQVQGDSIIDGDGKANIKSMQGATSSSDGEIGLVPQPLSADIDKFLKGDGTWATPTGDTPIYPIEFDAVTSIPFKNISTALLAALAKNLPYSGDATSDRKWLNNFRTICDMSKTNYEALSKYVNVGLITDYADDNSYGKVGKRYNSMMEVDPTKVTISKWSTNKIYTMTGKCRFHYFDSADGNLYVDATWSYTVMYNSAKDTYSNENMKVSLDQYA